MPTPQLGPLPQFSPGTTILSDAMNSLLATIRQSINSHRTPASDVDAGAFSAGDYSFPGALSVAGAISGLIDASQLNRGTIPDARFPSALPAISGAALTNLTFGNIAGVPNFARRDIANTFFDVANFASVIRTGGSTAGSPGDIAIRSAAAANVGNIFFGQSDAHYIQRNGGGLYFGPSYSEVAALGAATDLNGFRNAVLSGAVRAPKIAAQGGSANALDVSTVGGGPDHVYMSFYPRSANTGLRGAFIGFGGSGDNQLSVTAELGNVDIASGPADVILRAQGVGMVRVSNNAVVVNGPVSGGEIFRMNGSARFNGGSVLLASTSNGNNGLLRIYSQEGSERLQVGGSAGNAFIFAPTGTGITLAAGGVAAGAITSAGQWWFGASDPGGSEAVRVNGNGRFSGRLLANELQVSTGFLFRPDGSDVAVVLQNTAVTTRGDFVVQTVGGGATLAQVHPENGGGFRLPSGRLMNPANTGVAFLLGNSANTSYGTLNIRNSTGSTLLAEFADTGGLTVYGGFACVGLTASGAMSQQGETVPMLRSGAGAPSGSAPNGTIYIQTS